MNDPEQCKLPNGLHDFKDDTQIKQSVERGLYTKARYNYGIMSNVLMVAGPDIIRHIKVARHTVACLSDSYINIVDINEIINIKQLSVFSNFKRLYKRIPTWFSLEEKNGLLEPNSLFPITHNINITLGDISDQKSELFIDADLMSTIKTSGTPILKTLKRQRNTFPLGTQTKGFIFTISLRGSGGLNRTLDWVEHSLLPLTGSSAYIDRTEMKDLIPDTILKRLPENPKKEAFRIFYKDLGTVHPENQNILHDVTLRAYNDNGGPMLTGLIIYS